MKWIEDIEYKDLLEKDAALIFEHCGPEVLFALMVNLPGITIYLSEKPFFEMKKRYIRKFFNRDDPDRNAKALAAKLKVSEKFVYEAVASTGEKDDRQIKLL